MRDHAGIETDAGGGFVLQGLPSDILHVLTVRLDGYGLIHAVVPAGVRSADVGTLALEVPSWIRGGIETISGEAVGGAEITLVQTLPGLRAQDAPPPSEVERGCLTCSLVLAEATVHSDSHGRFEVRGMPLGRYSIEVNVGGKKVLERVEEISSRDTSLGTFTVEVRPGRLRGSVMIDGVPASGALVEVASPGSRSRARVTTDARGDFVILGLKEGEEYILRASGPRGERSLTREGIELDGPPLLLTL